MAAAIWVNYQFDLNGWLDGQPFLKEWTGWTLLFLFIFLAGYLIIYLAEGALALPSWRTSMLLLAAPVIFGWKMSAAFDFSLGDDPLKSQYWNQVVYWPLKMVVITLAILAISYWQKGSLALYGATSRHTRLKPYTYLLLCMVPLVIWAASRPSFMEAYPRFARLPLLQTGENVFEILVFELSYGIDFFTIEHFFRGFLILAFLRWAGQSVVLPMAMFYCAIHFGKPVAECISSFFGGVILGVVAMRTASIWGGLVVHLGIAWLMEAAGHIAHHWK